ncbi:hypothetical protein JZ751_015512 [Albula glossodonta]|uniref:Uncharacterized protein n=1 Tax=Albula glossodonta TaxID=121402 RepID=A0A8T2N1F5_9TELE|nr:hypothetical protein JZ751_015512 [Albula glossodonta]
MNVTNGSEASAGGEASEGATYVLSIYSRLCQDGPPCCTLVVPQGAMATSVLQDAVATLGVGGAEGGGADLYQLVEVREEGGPEFVLEGADRPVERVLLWPPHAQTQHPQSQGYYFLLRSHGDHSHGDGNSDGPFQEQDVDDLCSLSVLSEASILATLRTRFYANQIYTNAGGVLLALNPFCFLPIYNPIHMKLYNGQRPGRLRPHVFAMADRALCAMLHRRSSQAILITGHSGSGKTQTANFLLHCLTALSHKGYANGMKRTILGAGPVLEPALSELQWYEMFLSFQQETLPSSASARPLSYIC